MNKLFLSAFILLARRIFTEGLKVDIQPCIFSTGTIAKDVGAVSEAYMTSLFYDGFWSASKLTFTPSTTEALDLTHPLVAGGPTSCDDTHGKCNVLFIGVPLSSDQKAQVQK